MQLENPSQPTNLDYLTLDETRFFEFSLDLMTITGFDGHFKRVNPAFIQFSGYSQDELLSHSCLEFVHPNDIASTIAEAKKICAGEPPTNYFENRYRCKDGSYRCLSWTSFVVHESQLIYGIARDITQAKQSEGERQQLAERLRVAKTKLKQRVKSRTLALQQSEKTAKQQLAEIEAIYATAPVGLCVLDRDLRYVRINETLAQINGLPVSAHIGRSLREIVPELAEQQEKVFRQVLESGEPVLNAEISGTTSAQLGVERFWLVSYYPLKDAAGKILGVNTTVKEITDRKNAEAQLRQSEEQFRQLAENIRECIFWISSPATNQLIYVSPSYEEIWGRSAKDVYDDIATWMEAIHPDDRDRIHIAHVEQTARGGYDEEYRIVRPDGSLRWIRDRGFPIFDESGQISRLVGIAEDITDYKTIEASLRRSELVFRTLADTMPQMFWVTRPDGYHEYYNQRWYDYTGAQPGQTNGEGWQTVLHPDDAERTQALWQESLQTGKLYEIEYRFRRAADGEYRWQLGRAFPLRDQNGQILKWFGSCTDIHDQRVAIEERAQALERERAARMELEKANRMKDEFLAVLSHELRSPLNPILGWTGLLRTRQFDRATLDRALETIERNAKLQSQLIEDLLDVSRILRGKLTLRFSPVSLDTVIRAALETIHSAAEAKNIRIHTQLDPTIGKVQGDFNRLQQVLWNLLSNAVKFAPADGQVDIHLTQADSYAYISVIDTGKGIASEFLPHVFERFRQADSSTTRQFGGLGLGLAIVRHLVELHNGTIQVESEGEGKGTTFTVMLPLIPTPQLREQGDPSNTLRLTPDAEPLKHLDILIVDDEADARELLNFLLEQYGASVTIATSAAEVLDILEQKQPDLLISDLGMPETDGYSLIRQIRACSLEHHQTAKDAQSDGDALDTPLPAIALTGYARDEDRAHAIAAGFQAYLTKPFEPTDLVRTILQLMQGSPDTN
jgi:PAS domain S-box-containing protein